MNTNETQEKRQIYLQIDCESIVPDAIRAIIVSQEIYCWHGRIAGLVQIPAGDMSIRVASE
jgi:hypothetical protein